MFNRDGTSAERATATEPLCYVGNSESRNSNFQAILQKGPAEREPRQKTSSEIVKKRQARLFRHFSTIFRRLGQKIRSNPSRAAKSVTPDGWGFDTFRQFVRAAPFFRKLLLSNSAVKPLAGTLLRTPNPWYPSQTDIAGTECSAPCFRSSTNCRRTLLQYPIGRWRLNAFGRRSLRSSARHSVTNQGAAQFGTKGLFKENAPFIS